MDLASDADLALALQLQNEFYEEDSTTRRPNEGHNVVDDSLELFDPTPDIYALFREFDRIYFNGKLSCCEVKWSPKMTLCAGLCCYEGRSGLCSIRLSAPLLRLRPRKDLVQTLLHEMIHAYLFVTHNNKDHDAHGPEFLKHMHQINKLSGANITVYHTFHDEVEEYRKHWWQCNGSCKNRKPYFGLVKRAMNRAPGPNDTWWNDHQKDCNGIFTKIRSPEATNKGAKRKFKELQSTSETEMPHKQAEPAQRNAARLFTGQGHVLGSHETKDDSHRLASIEKFLKQVQSKAVTPVLASINGTRTSDILTNNSTKTCDSPAKLNATSPKGSGTQKNIDVYFGSILKTQNANKSIGNNLELKKGDKQGAPKAGTMSGKELYDWIISDDDDDDPRPKQQNPSAGAKVNITDVDVSVLVPCPACHLRVPESAINNHLDQCLNLN